MALLDSEITRIRFELGYNLLNVGAEPYVNVTAIFDQVVAVYLRAGATTTSSTAVTAASSPTPVALTLASAVGVSAGSRLVVDVDARQEIATVQSLAGAVATVQLQYAHSGTYPVTVEGGESIIRSIIRTLDVIRAKFDGTAITTAGVKKVDEVEFFPSAGARGAVGASLKAEQDYWRNELSSALGVSNLRRSRASAAAMVEAY